MFTVNDSEVVDCVHDRMSILSCCLHFHFNRRECPFSRRLPASKLFVNNNTIDAALFFSQSNDGLAGVRLCAEDAYEGGNCVIVSSGPDA